MHVIEEPMSHTDQKFHRKVAAECFNRTWDYLEQKNRSLDDDGMMLNLSFAKKALEISQKHNLSERLISAYEGMARAHAVAKKYPFAREFVSKAREQLLVVSLDNEDRKTYLDQIDETERMIPK
jgi:hypothetical protein